MGLHLGLGLTGQRVGFNPASLFAASEPGIWLDPSDLTTLFQDTAGTTPVTAAGQTVARVNDKSGRGNNATQATAASRPTYQVDGSGRGHLAFDGVDDFLVTPTITPNIDKAQVFAGVRRFSDTAGAIAEYSADFNSNVGSWVLATGTSTASALGNGFHSNSRGTAAATGATAGTTPATFVPPVTAVLTITHDISGDLSVARGNGVAGTNGTADKGAGNFLAYPLFIGRRGGTSVPFNGNLFSLVVRFGANLDAGTINQTETWVNSKTGAY